MVRCLAVAARPKLSSPICPADLQSENNFALNESRRFLLGIFSTIFLSSNPFVLLTMELSVRRLELMARYSAFLGRFVEVQYRAGDICLPASGTFVADSGRSVFLEQHYEQHGQRK